MTTALAWAAPAAAAPGVTPTVSGTAGADGWYRSAVTLRWAVGPEGLASTSGCEPATVIADDTPGVTKTCRATYANGVTMAADVVVKIDKTPPAAVHAATDVPANQNGWIARPVRVAWTGTDPVSGIVDCTSTPYAGPDVTGLALTGTCRDAAGNVSAPAAFTLNYDATAPTVTGALPARRADHRGWFLRPVAFAFQGRDGASGIDGCDVVGFAGPDGAASAVTGACRDRAGNAATGSVPVRYDGTPPALRGLRAVPGRRVIRLHWRVSRDARRVVVTRSPGRHGRRATVVYRGRRTSFIDRHVARDIRYAYRVTAVDAHAKTMTARVAATASLLVAPRRGGRVRGPVRLRWRAAAGARYYNVQVFRGSRRVRSSWPTKAHLRLRLRPGRYRWYVWPGFGSLADHPFGSALGRSTFTVVAGE